MIDRNVCLFSQTIMLLVSTSSNDCTIGLMSSHSTELAALRLVDDLTNEMDNFNVPINMYIDLSKAFDSLNHSILLNKLRHYGISGCSYELFCSYLSNGLQFVAFNGKMSTKLAISTGVPQGSVLGPLLFLIYINDLPMVSNIFTMLMYADDTTLYCNGMVWYGNSLFDITEKYIVIAKYLIKYMIYVWRLHKEYTGCSLPCSHQG